MIDSFTGEYDFLSNFYPSPITGKDGRVWPTAEHAFQGFKSLDRSDQEWVRSAPTPGQAKRRGRKITLRDDWDQRARLVGDEKRSVLLEKEPVKDKIMRNVVTAKFQQHPDLAEKLIVTGDQDLIEGNTWGDTYWGVCRGQGSNMLGQILMQVRSDLLSAIADKDDYDAARRRMK